MVEEVCSVREVGDGKELFKIEPMKLVISKGSFMGSFQIK